MGELSVTATIVAIQLLWGLVLILIGFVLKKISGDLEKNTEATQKTEAALHALHISAIDKFAQKADLDIVRLRVHEMRNDVTELQVRGKMASGK